MEKFYKILGLKLGASQEEVEEKYNELLKEFDPIKQPDELKEFFSVETEKVKEAYSEISSILINTEFVEKVNDDIKSDIGKKESENIDLDVCENEESFEDSQENNLNKFSISSITELKLKKAYLIMFILGFPLTYLIIGIIDGFYDNIIEIYYDVPFVTLLFHFIGAFIVLLFHIILIKNSIGFSNIRLNLADFFSKRKRYFLTILALTPIVLFSLYALGGMINYSDESDYWYNRYSEIENEVSGVDYDSGCNTRKALKIHNQSNRKLWIYISYKNKSGKWSPWLYWEFQAGGYSGLRWDDETHNNGVIYTSDYRYYIITPSNKPYLYSREAPHITNICNAKCINIY